MAKVKDPEMVEACRRFYLKFGGRHLAQVEAEMRVAGWDKFRRRKLHNSSVNGRLRLGWIDRFGWRRNLKVRKRKAAFATARRAQHGRRPSNFEKWLAKATPDIKWTAPHHRYICEHLWRVTDGTCRRLMIFLPPRHGKSLLVTILYTLWRLTRQPDMHIIIGCYNQKLANRFSRRIKKTAAAALELSRSRHAAEEWETAAGGGVKAVGVGAGVTGFGADLIIIDDPVKSRAEANSKNLRDKTWDWYKDDIHTRLEPGAALILIQTRWHDDDLAGRLMKEMADSGDQWEVINLPALAESRGDCESEGKGAEEQTHAPVDLPVSSTPALPDVPIFAPGSGDPLGRAGGEALWPERFGRDELLAKKRQMGGWSFSALYQQRPVPEGGKLFKIEWFQRRVSRRPDGLVWCRGYDLAVSLKTSADFTASVRCAFDTRTGDLYIADGFRKRIEFPEQRRFVIERIEAEPDTRHGIELALHGQALMQDLRCEPRIRGRNISGVKVDGDKLMRAEAWSGLAEEGKIVLVNGPWIDDFVDEACRFTGKGDAHDDQIDAVSLAVQMLRSRKGGYSF